MSEMKVNKVLETEVYGEIYTVALPVRFFFNKDDSYDGIDIHVKGASKRDQELVRELCAKLSEAKFTDKKPYVPYWLNCVCHDCDAKVGELHMLGCDMERCPTCGRQLISCGEEHYRLVEEGKMSRIPYIQPLVNCGICGIIFPDFFEVSDEEWEKYVTPPLQPEVLCEPCYGEIKKLFPNGWKALREEESNE